jgi:hypothetical protein
VIDLLTFFLDLLDVFLDFYLLLSSLEGIGVEKFAVECSYLLSILEKLAVGLGKLLFFKFLLEFTLLLIHFSALELLLLELFVPLLLLAFFEILEVISPLIRALLTLLKLIGGLVLLAISCIVTKLQLGIRFALIFILINSSWVIVIPALDVIRKLYFYFYYNQLFQS